jgi:hypothetical protein
MERDIFTPSFGTLDLLVFITLRSLGLVADRLIGGDRSIDAICEGNALRLYNHFPGQPIAAIKAIRAASDIGLRDAKQAWDQIVESYVGTERHYRTRAEREIKAGNYESAIHYLREAQREARGD